MHGFNLDAYLNKRLYCQNNKYKKYIVKFNCLKNLKITYS